MYISKQSIMQIQSGYSYLNTGGIFCFKIFLEGHLIKNFNRQYIASCHVWQFRDAVDVDKSNLTAISSNGSPSRRRIITNKNSSSNDREFDWVTWGNKKAKIWQNT